MQIDPGARVALWKVSGTHAVLPDGVPITATWDDLRRAYGPLGAFALNGTIYVTICRQPGIGAQMVLADPSAPINPENGEPQKSATIDSLLAGTRINLVEVSANLVRLHPNC